MFDILWLHVGSCSGIFDLSGSVSRVCEFTFLLSVSSRVWYLTFISFWSGEVFFCCTAIQNWKQNHHHQTLNVSPSRDDILVLN